MSEKRFNNHIAHRYDELCSLDDPYEESYHDRIANEVIEIVNNESIDINRILELGSGTGPTTWRLVKAMECKGRQMEMIGFDISAEMLKINKRKIHHNKLQGQNIAYVIGSGTHLPFRSNSFSLILCVATLHHIPNPVQVIYEMARILIPDGKVYLDEHLDNILCKLLRNFSKLFGYYKRIVMSPHEHQFEGFKREMIASIFRRHFVMKHVFFRSLFGTSFVWLKNNELKRILFKLDTIVEKAILITCWFPKICLVLRKK